MSAALSLPGPPPTEDGSPGGRPLLQGRWALVGIRPLAIGAGVLMAAVAVVATLVWRSPAFWCWQGDRALRGGQLVGAENAYNRALDLEDTLPEAIYGLGWTYLLAGLTDEAREQFRRCTQVAPGFFGGWRGLGALAAQEGEVLAAETHLRKAHGLAPGDPGVLTSLGEMYTAAGRYSEAEGLFQRAIAAEPYRGEYRIAFAEMLFARSDFVACRRVLEEAEALSIEEIRFRVAILEMRARLELFEAMAVEEASVTLSPSSRAQVEQHLQRAEEWLKEASAQGLEEKTLARLRRGIEEQRQRGTPKAIPPSLEP